MRLARAMAQPFPDAGRLKPVFYTYALLLGSSKQKWHKHGSSASPDLIPGASKRLSSSCESFLSLIEWKVRKR
jgi:hypothetical protein